MTLPSSFVREARVTYRGQRRRFPKLISSVTFARFVRRVLPHDGHERFVVLTLDAQNRPISYEVAARGSVRECSVDVSQVFRTAIVQGAVSVLLAHNHPSGDPRPSPEDNALTLRLVDAGTLLGIRVLDHVIVGDDVFEDESPTHYSYLDAGTLELNS